MVNFYSHFLPLRNKNRSFRDIGFLPIDGKAFTGETKEHSMLYFACNLKQELYQFMSPFLIIEPNAM